MEIHIHHGAGVRRIVAVGIVIYYYGGKHRVLSEYYIHIAVVIDGARIHDADIYPVDPVYEISPIGNDLGCVVIGGTVEYIDLRSVVDGIVTSIKLGRRAHVHELNVDPNPRVRIEPA